MSYAEVCAALFQRRGTIVANIIRRPCRAAMPCSMRMGTEVVERHWLLTKIRGNGTGVRAKSSSDEIGQSSGAAEL